MITHEGIWQAIDRLAKSTHHSTSGLARKAGLDPTAFNRSKRTSPDGKPRWPSTESISKILAVTGATLSEFLSVVDDHAVDNVDEINRKVRDMIPIIGYAQAGQHGFFDDAGYPQGSGWDYVRFPLPNHPVEHKNDQIYALQVSGTSMLPLYRDGDKLIVMPVIISTSSLRRGDRVIVKTVSGEVMAKELTKHTAERLELKSFNPDFPNLSFDLQDIAWVARIMWVSQ